MATRAMTQTQLIRHLAESCQLSNKVARQFMETALLQKSDSIPNALPPDRLGDGQKRLHLPI